ncbi:unnamed protein product [Ectocarpus sp. 13 AM-2016]
MLATRYIQAHKMSFASSRIIHASIFSLVTFFYFPGLSREHHESLSQNGLHYTLHINPVFALEATFVVELAFVLVYLPNLRLRGSRRSKVSSHNFDPRLCPCSAVHVGT